MGTLDDVRDTFIAKWTQNSKLLFNVSSALADVMEDLNNTNSDVDTLKTSVSSLEESVSTNTDNIDTMNSTVSDLETVVEGLTSDITSVQSEIAEALGNITVNFNKDTAFRAFNWTQASELIGNMIEADNHFALSQYQDDLKTVFDYDYPSTDK